MYSNCWVARCVFFFSSRRRHTRLQGDWSSDVCSSDLVDPFRNTRTGSQQKRPGGDNHRQDQCLIAVELHSSASLYVRKANMGVPPCQESRRITVLSYKD